MPFEDFDVFRTDFRDRNRFPYRWYRLFHDITMCFYRPFVENPQSCHGCVQTMLGILLWFEIAVQIPPG